MAEYDLVVRGGTVVAGTGAPERPADVAVAGGTALSVAVKVNGPRMLLVLPEARTLVPEIVPVAGSKLKPSGRAGVTAQVTGGVPPLVFSANSPGWPLTQAGRIVEVTDN